MESPLQCENLLKMNESLQKIDDALMSLNLNESAKEIVKVNENKENVSEKLGQSHEAVIGEQAINSIHLPYKHIAMKSGKNLRSKLLRVSAV